MANDHNDDRLWSDDDFESVDLEDTASNAAEEVSSAFAGEPVSDAVNPDLPPEPAASVSDATDYGQNVTMNTIEGDLEVEELPQVNIDSITSEVESSLNEERPYRSPDKVDDDFDLEDYPPEPEETSPRRRYDDYDDDDDDDRRGGRKSHVGIIIFLLAVAAAAAIGVYFVKKTGFEIKLPEFLTGLVSGTETTTAAPEPQTDVPAETWTKNSEERATDLARKYYSALQAVDMPILSTLVDSSVALDQANIEASSQYIEEYRNVDCYTAAGMNEGEYAAYISYDIKFKNIDTTAPGLVPAYMRPDETGLLRLIPYDSFDETITNYMTSLSGDSTIVNLRTSVTDNYNKAISSDPVLAQFITDLANGTAVIPETTAAPEPETQPETQPEETQPMTEEVEGVIFTVTDKDMWTFDNLRVRRTPTTDTDDNVVTTLGALTKVRVTGTSDVWYRINLENGEGPYFVNGSYLSEDPNHETTASSQD